MSPYRHDIRCPAATSGRGSHAPIGRRSAVLALVLGTAVFVAAAPAPAVPPPAVDDGALRPALAVNAGNGPPEPTQQRARCVEPFLAGPVPRDPPLPQRILRLDQAWQFSRGAGQKVAVVDTGVNRHPRLPDLQPGGDFVSTTDGTEDCDGHGTLVAGLIAARPGPDDAFAGVAPEASILSVRQLSLQYEAKGQNNSGAPGKVAAGGYGTVLTMAAAVVRAVDLGATVINLSEVSCTPAGGDTADGALGAAVKYAYDRNVVVVAAAGNIDSAACPAQNTGTGWGAVRQTISPAWFAPYVLAVAATDPDGSPSPFSIAGPWVGVAAPGRGIVSLDSRPGGAGLVDAERGEQGPISLDGTSFAAAFVSGVAALVRARFPTLTAAQVIERIERTAQNPATGRDDRLGYGLVDPTAALTGQLPDRAPGAGADVPQAIPAPTPPPYIDPLPRRVATAGSITLLALLGLGYAAAIPYRRRHPAGSVDPAADPESGSAATPAAAGIRSPEGR
ncbi:type VII secretion-associated serine protease mycosin [Nocardia sp. BMG111209]|uniref:type VII secretion-associated serine protease mycosin n=1 Tax=Nocardia sp. BMG111209 TaxID=1160137 RepID=UPI0003A7BC30|nr:type VII secretion-associated serine protease mycosin [Nocardia sp. BMG111209]